MINNLTHWVIRREYLTFLDGCPDNAVQHSYRVRGIDGLTDIRRKAEERIAVFPVYAPAFAELQIFVIPGTREHIQRHQRGA